MNILLDYDGTIHDTSYIYAEGFRKAYAYLVRKGYASPADFTNKEISKWLGYSAKEMWDTFMPELPELEKQTCISIVGEEMAHLLKEGKDTLYDGAINMLESLKSAGHTLIFLSNCTHEYMVNNREHFDLDRFYQGFYCTEDFNYAEKPKIFNTIRNEFPGKYVIIGDRFKDIEIGEIHGLTTIGCLYGFGTAEELKQADYKAESTDEIVKIIDKLNN